MSGLDARFVAMTLWMKMRMMNENMMDKMKMNMNGNMKKMKNRKQIGTMKSEDAWEYEWNND